MTVTRISNLCLVLMFAHSTLATYPYHPYPELQPSLPVTTHFIYNLPIDGRTADLAGYSYFTKNLGGGNNEVVFMTGPNSDAKMNDEVAAMKDQLSSPAPSTATDSTESSQEVPADSDSNKNSGDDKEVKSPEESPNASTPSTRAPNEATETSTPVTTNNGEKDGVNEGFNPDLSFVLRAPYPILRLRGSTTYYPQSTGVFPGYEPFDYFKSQYDPFYGHYSSYQTLYNPFYSAIDDYYSRLSPLPYQSSVHPQIGSNFVSGESLVATYPDFNGVQQVDKRFGATVESDKPDSTVEDSANAAAAEPQLTDGATAEKKTELPTSTEQSTESSTPVSATTGSEQSSSEASSTETTTTA